MYTAVDLSKYIVNKCIADGCPISNLQLQKILYYIQKDYLKRDMLAFSDQIEAWQFGPVVSVVYYHYCHFGGMPIFIKEPSVGIDSSDQMMIDNIIENKRRLDPWNMVADTHLPGGAWDQIYRNGQGNRREIPRELIKRVG